MIAIPVITLWPIHDLIEVPNHEQFCDASSDGICASASDKGGYEAIRWLHRQLDDDADGHVDLTETDGVGTSLFITQQLGNINYQE